MSKVSYKNSPWKRKVQNTIYSKVTKSSIIGLPGPDIEDYVDILKVNGFKDIQLYENDFNTFIDQLCSLPEGCDLALDNILEHISNDHFNDLDLCCCIRSVEDYLPEIVKLKEYALTLSIRPIGLEETFSIFRRYTENFKYIKYKDSSPMIVFYNI